MRGQALRGLRAPGCTSHFTSRAEGVVGPFSPSRSVAFFPSFPSSVPLMCGQQFCAAAIITDCQCQAKSGKYTLPNLSHSIREPDAETKTHKQALLSP